MRSEFNKKQQRYFNNFIDSIEGQERSDNSAALAVEYRAFLSLLKDLKNKKVLDIGCGRGRYSLRIAKKAKEVIGIDISDKSIKKAHKAANKFKVHNFKGIVSNFSTPLYENYFDYVIMVNLIHHVDDLDLIFKNVKKSLKKDGSLMIFEFNPLNLLFIPFLTYVKQVRSHFNPFYFRSNIFTLKKYLKENNFSIVSFKRYAFLPTVLYNYSLVFKKINYLLNKIPIINIFCAFHILECKSTKDE